jgi:hypothetical protein
MVGAVHPHSNRHCQVRYDLDQFVGSSRVEGWICRPYLLEYRVPETRAPNSRELLAIFEP